MTDRTDESSVVGSFGTNRTMASQEDVQERWRLKKRKDNKR